MIQQQVNNQLRIIRRTLRRGLQMLRYRHLSLAGVPIFFANAFPKSGTHLLTQALIGFTHLGPAVNSGLRPIVTYEGDTGLERAQEDIQRDLERLLPGDIAYGHLHATAANSQFLCRSGFVPYFLLRDPRDVAVSHAHYVTDMEAGHIHHQHYTQVLGNFDERLHTSIAGIPGNVGPVLPDIYQRFAPYVGWLEQPSVLVVRFEGLIQDRMANLAAILDHAVQRGFPLSSNREHAIQTIEASIDPQRSPTFRRGRVGGWREAFSDEHRRIFKEVSGDLLVRLGYERDSDW